MKKRQTYHLESKIGLINDPNGLVYFNDNYHVFFQWNPFEKNHSYKEWGHFISKDLKNWKFQGTAISPDQLYDKNGVYSGSSYVNGNQLFLYYTGNNKTDGIRKSSQCLAVTEDGKTFLKKGVILSTPEEFTEHFRDPKVWSTSEGLYMVIGAQRKNGKGAIAICKSIDGYHWKFEDTLAKTADYEMIECPDLFRLGQNDFIIYCLQKRDNEKDIPIYSFTVCKEIHFDAKKGTIEEQDLDHGYTKLDYGFDFYAPQTFLAPDGRRLLFAWMSRMDEEEEKLFSEKEKNIHCMTIPRQLAVHNGNLCQMPVKELQNCLLELEDITKCKLEARIELPNRVYCTKLDQLENENELYIELQQKEVIIHYNREKHIMSVKRMNWVTQCLEERTCEMYNLENMEIWSDNSSVEIFVNQGATVFSQRIFPGITNGQIRIKKLSENAKVNVYNISIEEGDLS